MFCAHNGYLERAAMLHDVMWKYWKKANVVIFNIAVENQTWMDGNNKKSIEIYGF